MPSILAYPPQRYMYLQFPVQYPSLPLGNLALVTVSP
jgi:hypothetical protein